MYTCACFEIIYHLYHFRSVTIGYHSAFGIFLTGQKFVTI